MTGPGAIVFHPTVPRPDSIHPRNQEMGQVQFPRSHVRPESGATKVGDARR